MVRSVAGGRETPSRRVDSPVAADNRPRPPRVCADLDRLRRTALFRVRLHRSADGVRLGGGQPPRLRHHAAQRPDRGGCVLRRCERVHAHLRVDARGEHGAWCVLSARRLHRVEAPAQVRRRRPCLRPAERAGGLLAVAPAGTHRRALGRRPGSRCPAGVPPLESGPGASSGADHDRDLGDPRRPDDRPLRFVRARHLLARCAGPTCRRSGRRSRLHADSPLCPRGRHRRRSRALALAQADKDGNGHPRRSRRPGDGRRHSGSTST